MKIYMVGGAVRDFLNGVTPKDTDYVVVGSTPDEMLAKGFTRVGADFPVFLHPETHDEYALARTERKSGAGHKGFITDTQNVTLEEDLTRRDLTINAMAMDEAFNLIDPCGGKADLNAKILRHVSPAFEDDPLRVLRVARFMARFGPDWQIAPETMELMQRMVDAGQLDELTRERIWAEIEKGLTEQFPEQMLEVFWKLQVLRRPAFAEFSGGLYAQLAALQRAVASNQHPVVRFALAFPRQWHPLETKNSKIPKQYREVCHCLYLGISKGLGHFSTLPPAEKVELLQTLDVLRQGERMRFILDALSNTHREQVRPISEAILAIVALNKGLIVGDLKNAADIKTKLQEAYIEAVAKVSK